MASSGGLLQALEWKLAVLVDEAHNLVERALQMYTAELRLGIILAAARAAPAALRSPLGLLAAATQALAEEAAGPHAAVQPVPDSFTQALQTAAGALAANLQQQPLAVGGQLSFHFELQRFLRLVEALSDASLFDLHTTAPNLEAGNSKDGEAGTAEVVLCVHNVAPAIFLRQRLKMLQSLTLFSATLAPPSYAIKLLGLPEDTAWIDVPSAFPAEHLTVQVAHDVSTRFPDRTRSLQRLVGIMAAQFDAHPGNYLAFFSSFKYMDKAVAALARVRPEIPVWKQERRMGEEARQGFLARFQPQGRGIGFAVLGGVFAEGVDLLGSLLIGAFIATLGLPPVSEQQTQVQARLAKLLGSEAVYGDLVPAMQKVVQAAGRVLRTPEDRGWLWLLDDRYRRSEVMELLPAWWRVR